jgi:tRNA(Arg) A34 adenosine deaminase TadA
MCAGTVYWANIGAVSTVRRRHQLLALTGDSPDNPTLDLPCREVFARGQKTIRVSGPFPELADELIAPHLNFWQR